MGHPERIVPDETPPGIIALHLKRYAFARPLCADKSVLDAACGVGYGTAYIGEVAASVLGVDINADAVEYAERRYAGTNVRFERHDLLDPALQDAGFDVVCSFETIEHLADPARFLGHVARVLRPDGICIVSTPRASRTTHAPENPFHRIEFSRRDFEAVLTRFFSEVEIWGQRRLQSRRHRLVQQLDVLGLRKRVPALRRAAPLLGTPPLEATTFEDIDISRTRIDEADELIAVCHTPR